jgi:hypothetical protein
MRADLEDGQPTVRIEVPLSCLQSAQGTDETNEAFQRNACKLRKLKRRFEFVPGGSEAGSINGESGMRAVRTAKMAGPGHTQ